MIKKRILFTLRFFDLQDYPLTLLELHSFLLTDFESLKSQMNVAWEFVAPKAKIEPVGVQDVLACLRSECGEEIEEESGFYCLKGRSKIIRARLRGYLFGLQREKIIKKFAPGLKFIPFVRGAALAGSQALGRQTKNSDIDLFIIIEPKFLWLGRLFVTGYFQVLGLRRHGLKIANRFCLNHYVAGPKALEELRNVYTASEYAKLRPLVYGKAITEFQQNNLFWLRAFLPNFQPAQARGNRARKIQKFFEKPFSGSFGFWLESLVKKIQLRRIRREEFILVQNDELSFHPSSKQTDLLNRLFVPEI